MGTKDGPICVLLRNQYGNYKRTNMGTTGGPIWVLKMDQYVYS